MSVDAGLLARVRVRLAGDGGVPTPGRVAAALREEGGALRGDAELLGVLRTLQSEIAGAGVLEPLLADPTVTDVLVNGPHEVWVDRGQGLERTAVRFTDDLAVRRLAVRLAAPSGRRLDDAQPWVDARLANGVRLHAVLPPVAPGGTCLSLRVPRRRVFDLEELVAVGSVPLDGADLLRRLVAARTAFLVTGGTGTGKTTLLSALLSVVDVGDRVLLVEDAGELAPDHPHVVRLEARPANVEGAGAVTLRDLVRQALRMRPDRLVVGEVRGAEVVDLLAALNTGHEGGCGTLHANSAEDVPARLEALAAVAGLTRQALHSQLASGLRVVVHLVRPRGGGVRRVAELCVLTRGPDRVPACLRSCCDPAAACRAGRRRRGRRGGPADAESTAAAGTADRAVQLDVQCGAARPARAAGRAPACAGDDAAGPRRSTDVRTRGAARPAGAARCGAGGPRPPGSGPASRNDSRRGRRVPSWRGSCAPADPPLRP